MATSRTTRDPDTGRAWPLQMATLTYSGFSGMSGKGGGDMAQGVALLLLATAVVLWLRYAPGQKKRQAVPAAKRVARNPHHCVEVCAGDRACEAVRRLGNSRYLPGEAPALPVSGCTEQACACGYIHHEDRRVDDRRNPCGQWRNLPHGIEGERRSRNDRRASQESAFRPSMAH